MKLVHAALCATAMLAMATAAQAQIKVGFVTSLSGAGSSIGIPYSRGLAAAYAFQSEVGGQKVTLIQLDDGADPSAATRDARKLVEEEKVDVLIGTATAPSAVAMAAVANELKVPYIAIAPINAPASDTGERWALAVPQPPSLMVKVVTDRIKREGVKNLAFIGFSDVWGDFVYNGAKAAEAAGDLKVVTNERYGRTDTSVTGQTLKIVAAHPDGVLDGGAGTQGALPLLALSERGYKGKLYGTPGLINADFIRIAGKSAEGMLASSGPVLVAEQLPDGHFAKAISLKFREAYQKANGAAATDGFSPYAFDGWLLFLNAASRVGTKATPGTPAYRTALRDALFSTKELAGTMGVYNFTPAASYGVDERSLVLIRLVNGAWKYEP